MPPFFGSHTSIIHFFLKFVKRLKNPFKGLW
jgi:hypothetical protein